MILFPKNTQFYPNPRWFFRWHKYSLQFFTFYISELLISSTLAATIFLYYALLL